MQVQAYINLIGLVIAGSASLYLTGNLFWDMGIGTSAFIFLCIGISAEAGKYCAVGMTTKHGSHGNKGRALTYGCVTFVLVSVSLTGSIASLLITDTQPSATYQDMTDLIKDVDADIALERENMKNAARVNAQTAGVAPARNKLNELRQRKDDLIEKKLQIGEPESSALASIVSAITSETGLETERIRLIFAISVAILLEGLCVFFAIASTPVVATITNTGSTSGSSGSTEGSRGGSVSGSAGSDDGSSGGTTGSGGSSGGSEVAKYKDTESEPDKFDELVAAIKAGKLEPTHENIRVFMAMRSGKVREVKEQLKAENVVVEIAGGRLIPA